MCNIRNIKALLFDSGRVLNYPQTGNWFIPPNFFQYIDRTLFESINKQELKSAFYKANNYLQMNHYIQTEQKELETFIKFYTIIFEELADIEVCNNTIKAISEDTVYNDDKFVFYDDVFEFIPLFSQDYRLGVVSDTWPSLDRVFRSNNLRDYFSTFVMSSKLGVWKPDQLMFNTALNELNMKPDEVLFIDDSIKNVEGAMELGIQSILMTRDNRINKENMDILSVNNLKELYILMNK